MIDQADPSAADPQALEAALRLELARGDAAAAAALPVLRHLVAAQDNALLGEETLVRVRAMLADIAAQLLDALIGAADRRAHAPDEIAVLTRAFLDDAILLGHVHAIALEWQLTERLQASLALDPVASPLLLARVAQGDAPARAFLAAQARWTQAQRRGSLPLAELPEAVLGAVLAILRMLAGAEPALAERVSAVEIAVHGAHAGDAGRLSLADHVAAGLGDAAPLSIGECGVALFLTLLAQRARQPREAIAIATLPGHRARLVLALAAAGADGGATAAQLMALDPAPIAPARFGMLDAVRAAAILAEGGGQR